MFIHSPELINTYPNNFTGVIKELPMPESSSLTDKAGELLKAFKDVEEKQEETRKSADNWQLLFSKMGAKPKYKSSITSILDCFQTKKDLWDISPIVNFYNTISLVVGVPMAAYNADKLGENVELRHAKPGELFTPLGNPSQKEKTRNGEVIYADEEKVICRYWNLKDCDESKISEDTKNISFFFDIYAENSDQANKKIKDIVVNYFQPIWEKATHYITGKDLNDKLKF